jgi:hypothetical protein
MPAPWGFVRTDSGPAELVIGVAPSTRFRSELNSRVIY